MNDRQQKILAVIERTGSATVEQLQAEVFASPATVRRDLKTLENEGAITRVWGGASTKQKANSDLPTFIREIANTDKKKTIARKALKFINDGDCLFLPSGTTVGVLCKYLGEVNDLTVITNCIDFVDTLRKSSSTQVFVTAGKLHERYDLVGSLAISSIEKFNADCMFFSCSGISADGFTSNDLARLEVFETMARHSKKTILLCDSTKVGEVGTYSGFPFDKIDFVIIDKKPKDEQLIKTLGNKLILCE